MTLVHIVTEIADKLNIRIAEDVIPMFKLVFSKLGKPDEYLAVALNKLTKGMDKEEARLAKLNYLVDDILTLAGNGARDGGFDFVDGYLIWLIAVTSFSGYLRHDMINLPYMTPHKVSADKIGYDKIQYPAYGSIIRGYASLAPYSDRSKIIKFLHDHFKNSDIKILNLTNVYNEIIKLSSGGPPIDLFSSMPDDIKYNIALWLDYDSIIKLCATSRKFTEVCINESFWQNKTEKDFSISGENFTQVKMTLLHNREVYIKMAAINKVIIPGIEKYIYANDILIFGASPLTKSQDIIEEFRKFGQIKSVVRKGTTFLLTFYDYHDAENAYKAYQGITLHGNRIRLVKSQNSEVR